MKLTLKYDLQTTLDLLWTLAGGFFLVMSWVVCRGATDDFLSYVTCGILLIMGTVCICVGLAAFILRNDPDMWPY